MNSRLSALMSACALVLGTLSAIAGLVHLNGGRAGIVAGVIVAGVAVAIGDSFASARTARKGLVRLALLAFFALSGPFIAIALSAYSALAAASGFFAMLVTVALVVAPTCTACSVVLFSNMNPDPRDISRGGYYASLGLLVGGVLFYLSTFFGLPVFVPAVAAGVLIAGAVRLASFQTEEREKRPEIKFSFFVLGLSLLSGCAVAVAFVSGAHVYRMFQMPQPLAPLSVIVAAAVAFTVGFFLARKKFRGLKTEFEPQSWAFFALLLTGLSLLWFAAMTNVLGVFLLHISNMLPQESAVSVLALILIKALVLWGPFFCSLGVLLTCLPLLHVRQIVFLAVGATSGLLAYAVLMILG
ncbi:MAG: hypothetical protein U5N86_10060 [Planctomycetota bacterium]|nr:hypothetical protein [Planctomycetota bacterium]